MPIPTGTLIAKRFEVIAPLGRGSMGEVFEAHDRLRNERVALKVLHVYARGESDSYKRFLREAQAASMVTSPHVARVLGIDEDDRVGTVLIFERLEGETLADLLKARPVLALPELTPIMSGVLKGLEAAHGKGIIHRDLKPSNIFLERRVDRPTATVKLLDFGISKLPIDEARTPLTRPNTAIGSAAFIAPEQLEQAATVDGRADLYSAGIIAYMALSGDTPFAAPSMAEMLKAKLAGKLRPLGHDGRHFPPAIVAWVHRALSRMPDGRHPNAHAALTAWEDAASASAPRLLFLSGSAMRAPDNYLGREIANGKYQILQKIGSGGMGAVYKALQPNIGRMVAIKILHPKLVNRKDLVSRFSREAKALGHLSHPNTVKVIDDGELEDGSLYIVMEFLEGRNLNQIVRSGGPMPVERALPILVQVCGALEEAHQRGIVHRDLKPENIFLCNQGGVKDFPKVLDFGLAKVTEKEMRPGSIILTQEGMVFGTPEFMSPEQAQGRTLDARSDIYSLAVILYEVLTGKLPFDAKTPMEYIQHHVMTRPIPLDQRAPQFKFPPGLGDVLTKALSKEPGERYATAAEFGAALDQFIGGRTPASQSSTSKPEPDALNRSFFLAAPESLPAPKQGTMNIGIVVAVAVGCLVVGGLITFFVMKAMQ